MRKLLQTGEYHQRLLNFDIHFIGKITGRNLGENKSYFVDSG